MKQRASYSQGTTTKVAEFYNIAAKCIGNCIILHFTQTSVLVIFMKTYFRLKEPFAGGFHFSLESFEPWFLHVSSFFSVALI